MPGTLYGVVLSPNVARVLVVSKFLGVPLTIKPVDLRAGEQKQEHITSLNPFGAVPIYTSEDGKLTLFESRGIARYLDVANGGKLLKIAHPAEYGKVETWAAVEASTFSKQVGVLFLELIAKPLFRKQPTDQAAVDSNKADLNNTLAVYEKHLSTSKTAFLAADEVTIADLFHLPLLAPLIQMKFLSDILTPYPHVSTWFSKLLALPAWQEVQDEQLALLKAYGVLDALPKK